MLHKRAVAPLPYYEKTVNRHLLLLLLTQEWSKLLWGQKLNLQRADKNYCNLDMWVSGFQEQSGT